MTERGTEKMKTNLKKYETLHYIDTMSKTHMHEQAGFYPHENALVSELRTKFLEMIKKYDDDKLQVIDEIIKEARDYRVEQYKNWLNHNFDSIRKGEPYCKYFNIISDEWKKAYLDLLKCESASDEHAHHIIRDIIAHYFGVDNEVFDYDDCEQDINNIIGMLHYKLDLYGRLGFEVNDFFFIYKLYIQLFAKFEGTKEYERLFSWCFENYYVNSK